MIGLKKKLLLTVSGDCAQELQLLARNYDMRLEDLTSLLMTLLFEYERLSREGYHIGVGKDPSQLDIQFIEMWN